MADEGRTIEDIAADLRDTREQLREARAEADKTPSLRREVERLEGKLSEVKHQIHLNRQEREHLQTRVSELESQVRDQGELQDARQRAEDKARAAIEERDEAHRKLRLSESDTGDQEELIERLTAQLNKQNQVIAAAKEDVATRDKLRSHLEQM